MKRKRLVAISLRDIPYAQRMHAARIAARECNTDAERDELLLAALVPSDKRYWIYADERELAAA